MPQRLPSFALAIAFLFLGSAGCKPPVPPWAAPLDDSTVDTYSFEGQLVLDPSRHDVAGAQILLNGVAMAAVEGPPGTLTIAVAPGPPLRDKNVFEADVPLLAGGNAVYKTKFFYLPPGKASAFEIEDPADLLTGPLAHNRKGDFMLSNDRARFVVQQANVRDLHSVGQYGGNLIDAELLSNPGNDNFFEMSTSVNVESVINATSVTVLNDGQDGTAAIVEACGPDDLLDYINASSQVEAFGVVLPAGLDDQDYEVEGCTQYVLEPRMAGDPGNRVTVTTTIFNNGPDTVELFPGDYLNGMGELEQYTRLDDFSGLFFDAGIGELTAIPGLSSFSYFGFGQGAGTSYGRIGLASTGSALVDSSFSTSGVSFVLTENSVTNILLPGVDPPTLSIDPGDNAAFSRVFVVGDGSASDVIDAEIELLGTLHGTLQGCVTVGGVPAPGARVAVGPVNAGRIQELASAWVTDAAGCYEGSVPVGSFSVAAAKEGVPYEGGGILPLLHPVLIADGGVTVQDIALPATGRLRVVVEDPNLPGADKALPARISVVGADPSPEPVITFNFLGFFVDDSGTFNDITKDPLPSGITAAKYTGADGIVEFDVEPGAYEVVVSRGTEYSRHSENVVIVANATETVDAELTRVLDTTGFVSSDYHVHSINSPDSRISLRNRVEQFAGEGVENFIATDHDARTDPNPTIQAEGLTAWLKGTIGEEITTFDTGHYNGYPLGIDPERPSGGSTDWARPEPPGQDFPSNGAYIRSPEEIHDEVLNQLDSNGNPLNTSNQVVVHVNHIGSHFGPLKIDTSQEPPQSFLGPGEPEGFRLDPGVANFFHHFPALELWNGSTNGAQNEFLIERIGVWMNLLNQGLPTTFIADTDTHTFLNLRTAGARTWTAAPDDAPDTINPEHIGRSVLGGRATGGQGLYVQTRLVESDDANNEASLGWNRSTTLTTAGDGDVTLVIDVQAPIWAPFDVVEVYANAETFPVGFNDG
ncbi:MAG: PHP domain-containing protein, partial [Myxococcales bacterium]|nr:PHP domain-containing protein [Myxococcales bacterium]